MTTESSDGATREQRLDEALVACLEAEQHGATGDRQALLARYPEFAAELSELYAGHDLVDRFAATLRQQEVDASLEAPVGLPPWLAGSQRIGGYELKEVIGEGGMGIVHKAWQIGLKRWVAVKMIRTGLFAGPDEVRRFRDEAKHAAGLKHRNIVTIYEVGEHHGLPYFSMEYIEGQNLAEMVKDHPLPPEQAAAFLKQIAEAIQFAHEGRVLHRDLKPSNVLIDASGNAHVTDFGLAAGLDEDPGITASEALLGTPSYCPPEQTGGRKHEIGERSDVYSMGAILYELLTGHPPFKGVTPTDTLLLVRDAEPISPQRHNPRIPLDLETICLKCLAKRPEHRYATARELAEDLALFLERRPIKARPVGVATRLLRFCLRHPVAAGLLTALVTFLVIMTPSAIWLARGQEAGKRAQIRQVNMNSASMVAGTVLSQLRALSDAVERAAAEKELAQALEGGDVAALQAFCESTYKLYEDPSRGLKLNENSPFDTWIVLNNDGVLMAHARKPGTAFVSPVGKGYEWREYFVGASKLAGRRLRSTYVSAAFKSEADGYSKFSISTPIYRSDGTSIGVLVGSVVTRATLGSLVLDATQSAAVLVAPSGRERAKPTPETPYLVLFHPTYTYGQVVGMDNEQVRKVSEPSLKDEARIERPLGLPRPELVTSSDDYRDPVAERHPEYAGRWLAGFAPVGNTGFVVIVQTREDKALESEMKLGWQLSKWAGIAGSPGALLVLLAVWYERRRAAKRALG